MNKYAAGYTLILAFVVIRAFYSPTFKFMTGFLHPFSIGLYAAIISLVIFYIASKRKTNFHRIKDKKYYLKLYFLSFIGGLLIDLSFLYLEVKAFAIFISILPIVVSFYSGYLLKERTTKTLWLAALLAFAGSLIFRYRGALAFGTGDYLVVVGVILFGLISILQRKYVKQQGTYEFLLTNSLLGFLPIIFIAGVTGNIVPFPANTIVAGTFILYIVVIILSGIFAAATHKLVPAYIFSTLTTALVPLGAILLGITFLGETVSLQEMIGGAIMISASIIAVNSTRISNR